MMRSPGATSNCRLEFDQLTTRSLSASASARISPVPEESSCVFMGENSQAPGVGIFVTQTEGDRIKRRVVQSKTFRGSTRSRLDGAALPISRHSEVGPGQPAHPSDMRSGKNSDYVVRAITSTFPPPSWAVNRPTDSAPV